MEWIILIVSLIGFGTISEKLDKLKKEMKAERKTIDLKKYLNKNVSLTIDNDEISNSYLFSSVFGTVGVIKDYDQEWVLFEYKEKKKTIEQYIRISDITSINEKSA